MTLAEDVKILRGHPDNTLEYIYIYLCFSLGLQKFIPLGFNSLWVYTSTVIECLAPNAKPKGKIVDIKS